MILLLTAHYRAGGSGPPFVSLISAGADQVVLNATVIYLTAVFTGSLTQHTTEWEQLTGDPISIVTVDASHAYFVAPGGFTDDKRFRFYIDRGMPSQQYSDVTIYGTPSALVPVMEYGISASGRYPDYMRSNLRRWSLSNIFNPTIPFNSNGSVGGSSAVLTWTLPEIFYIPRTAMTQLYIDTCQGTVLEQWTSGSWHPIYTVGLSTPCVFVVTSGKRYRVGAIYHRRGSLETYVVYSRHIDVGQQPASANAVVSQTEYGITAQATTTRLVLTLVERDPDTDSVEQWEYGIHAVTAVTRTVTGPSGLESDESVVPWTYGLGAAHYTVFRSAGDSLGG